MKKVFFALQIAFFTCVPLLAGNNEADSLKILNLQEVEIVSVRAGSKTPVAYSNLDKMQISSLNFGQDAASILATTPSVIITSDAGNGIGYTGFRIRGTDANRINITANGIPLNDSESHGVFWVNMPDFASSLEDLQIQRGVGTSTNGAGAFGASINMKTSNISREAYSEFNGGYGSFNSSKATFKAGSGLLADHWTFDARLSSIHSDGFIDRAETNLKSYFAQASYLSDNTMLRLLTFGGKEKTYHAWDGVPDYILFPTEAGAKPDRTHNPCGYMGADANGNPLYYSNQTDNYDQTHYQLFLLQSLAPNLNLNVALHYTKGLGYYEEYKTGRKFEEYGLQNFVVDGVTVKKSDLVRQKHLDNDFGGAIFSLDYRKGALNAAFGGGANRYWGNHFGKVIWLKNYYGDASLLPDHEYYRSKGEKTDANLYLKASWQLTEKLNLYGDLQYRRIDYAINGQNDVWDWINAEMQKLAVDEKFNFFNPKAGAFYQFNAQNSAYASFATANREPNRNNYTDAAKNEIPRPERLYDWEAGYRFGSPQFSAGLNLYWMQYRNQLVLNGKVNEIGEPLTSNVPDSYRAGMELTASLLLTHFLKWDGNLTLSRNRIKNYTEYVTVYDVNGDTETEQKADFYGDTPIAYSPDVIAGSRFSLNFKQFRAALQSNYVSRQFLDNTGKTDRTIDSYFVNNLTLGYDFKIKGVKQVSVNLLINNLFNEEYETYGYLWSCYNRQADGSLDAYTEHNYFPQAGINFMTNISLKF
ncbi:MAG: TonB-dependent receptor [Dysgonamonadaceae bacterium]|jgi:iron complex outermembrane receptor protein|nr:TonB-dependent receptor [Dysgonamonadaceae bacterium]